jgi:hypothetical protein
MLEQREFCLKLWQGHCKYEPTVNGVFKFIRHHFIRSYYSNRAPVVLHLNADWLKEYVTTTKNELVPDIGYSKKEKTNIPIEVKNYNNLDGLIKFINETTRNNKDVYFVTAQQAIAWTRLMPRIEEVEIENQILLQEEDKMRAANHNHHRSSIKDKKDKLVEGKLVEAFNLSRLFDEVFEDIECKPSDHVFDGSCSILKQMRPDYDLEDDSFELDDNYEILLKKKLKVEHTAKMNVLAELQSEILFINHFVVLFIVSLVLLLVVIVLKDKFF